MKALVWLAASLEDVRSFPDEARRNAGYQLYRVQAGLEPTDWRPMGGVGRGVMEVRIRGRREYRVLYVASFEEAVYVLHAFAKRTRRTSRHDLEVAATRYRALLAAREESR